MATGDVKWFAQFEHDLGNKLHDLDGDDWRMGIVTTGTVPTIGTAAPHWGGTGTTNFASTQVGTSGTSYTAPIVLTGESWTVSSPNITWDANDISLAQDALGFTNGAYGIFFNNTDTNKRCAGYIELSSAGTLSLVTGAVNITFNASGILRATAT